MRRLILLAACLMVVAVAGSPLRAANNFKRMAVMPFENTTKQQTVEWVGTGIAESLITDLAKFPDFTLVERTRLNDALKEIKLGQSGSIDPATAQKMGRILGADAIVVGSYQVVSDAMTIFARVIETETAQVRVTAKVDGSYKNVLGLQTEIASKLVEELKGSLAEADKRKLEAMPSKSVEAVQALSDGVYFLRTDLVPDALKEFDRAIALDPNFTEAHYYRGVALAKLKRWDDAIASLKRTLPRTQAEQTVKWSWTPPVDAQGSRRGLFFGVDQTAISTQGPPTSEEKDRARKGFAYTEQTGKNTVFHFVDPVTRKASRVEIPDDTIPIGIAFLPANERSIMIPASTPAREQAGTVDLYAVSAEGVLWHSELKGEAGKRPPDFDLWGDTLFEFYSNIPKVVALDAATHTKKWERDGLISWPWHFKVKGNLVLLTSPSDNKIHGIRLSDGQDLWTIDYTPTASYQLVTDRALIVFEPDKRVFAADLQTGKIFADVATPPLMFSTSPYIFSVPALVDNNTLYFISNANELVAVDLNPAAAANRRLLWKTTLQAKFQTLFVSGSQIYGSAPTGELLIADRTSGAVRLSKKVSDRPLTLVYAGPDVVLANTPGVIYGFEPGTGNKLWETANFNPTAGYFKGIVVVQSSSGQFGMFDAATGNLVQQYAGSPVMTWMTDDSAFILESAGVREFGFDRAAVRGVTNKEAMTELASVLLAKGDLDEATRFADRVAREGDPNYPPLHYVLAQLNLAKGNAAASRQEFVAYTDLVGHQSKAAQAIIESMKVKDGLVWQAEVGGGIAAAPILADGKIIVFGKELLAVLDEASGKMMWRQSLEGLVDLLYTHDASRRIFYATVDSKDPKTFRVYSTGLDGTNRKELFRNTLSTDVAGRLQFSYSRNRLFVKTLSVNPQSGNATVAFTAVSTDTGAALWDKKHELLPEQMGKPRAVGGLFFPKGDRLVYSLGSDLWILQGQDGSIYAEQHETGPIATKRSYVDVEDSGPDAITYAVDAKDVVTYKLSTKQVVLRAKLPSQDPGFSPCACLMRGTMFIEKDGASLVAYDMDSTLADANRVKWRLSPGPGQAYARLQFVDNVLIMARAPAGIASQRDVTFLNLDFETGKTLQEIEPLWFPAGLTFAGKRLVGTTIDGMVYALEAK